MTAATGSSPATRPRGQVNENGEGLSTGALRIDDDDVDGINAQFGSTVTKPIGDLTLRVTARGEVQREVNPYTRADGTEFTVSGVKRIDVATNRTATSSITDRRTNAGFTSVAVDYAGKYIADALVRREGSSLFGPQNRWNTFYRGSAAWLINEESWFNVGFLDLFKLRYTVGTAGVRPGFSDQYEALAVSTGAVVRTSLGNQFIEPEIAHGAGGRPGHDHQPEDLRLLRVRDHQDQRQPDRGAGAPPWPATTRSGRTWARSRATRSRPPFRPTCSPTRTGCSGTCCSPVTARATSSASSAAPATSTARATSATTRARGEWYGNFHVKDFNQLRPIHANSQDQFQVDDNGYVVPVGTGNNFTDGKAKGLWGTTVRIDGVNYAWGRPFLEIDSLTGPEQGRAHRDFLPDFSFGFGNTFRYKGFRLYTLFTGQMGGEIYNQVKQSLYASNDHPDVNQSGKPDELRKNTTYYSTGIAQGNSPYRRDFVEDATHVRLQELAFGYLFDVASPPVDKKIGANRIQADLSGRNVLTSPTTPASTWKAPRARWSGTTARVPAGHHVDRRHHRHLLRHVPLHMTTIRRSTPHHRAPSRGALGGRAAVAAPLLLAAACRSTWCNQNSAAIDGVFSDATNIESALAGGFRDFWGVSMGSSDPTFGAVRRRCCSSRCSATS